MSAPQIRLRYACPGSLGETHRLMRTLLSINTCPLPECQIFIGLNKPFK